MDIRLKKTKIEKNCPNKNGFSLIEMMMVIFILTLIIGMTVVHLSDTKSLDEVEAAARGISSLLREAQNSALTGREQSYPNPSNPALNIFGPVCRYSVTLDNSGSNIEVKNNFYHVTGMETCFNTLASNKEKTSTFKNVNISAGAPIEGIDFEIPSGQIKSTLSFPLSIKINSTRNNNVQALVCVYVSGKITEKIGATASCT